MFPLPLTQSDVAGYRVLVAALCLAALATNDRPKRAAGQAVALADALIEELGLLPPPPPEDSEPAAF